MPSLPLDERPTLNLTPEEKLAIYKGSPTGTGKILKNQAQWKAYAETAEVVSQGYQDYIKDLFTPEKKEPPKSWWQFWK